MTADAHAPRVPAASPGRGARWLEAERTRTARDHPRLWRWLSWCWHRPALLLASIAALTSGALGATIPGGDAEWFRRAGSAMLGPGLLHVFAEPGLQIGPVYLVVLGVAVRLLEALGLPLLFPLAAAQAAGLAWFAIWTARRAARAAGAPELPAQWAVGVAVSLGGLIGEGLGSGHPEEILVGLLLANAALAAGAGRHGRAGLLVGLATGVKQWGLLGAGVLLLGRDPRRLLLGGAAAALVVLALYAPFALVGDLRTFEMDWGISDRTLLGTVAGWAGDSDWALRLVQGAVAGLAGLAVAWRRHGSPLLVVVVSIAVRLLLDPLRLGYYTGPLLTVLVIWLWTTDSVVVRPRRLVLSLVAPLVTLVPHALPVMLTWRLGDVLLVVLPVACVVAEKPLRRRPAPDPAVGSVACG